jgi:protein SCO1/2
LSRTLSRVPFAWSTLAALLVSAGLAHAQQSQSSAPLKTQDKRLLPADQQPHAAPDKEPEPNPQTRGLDIEEKIGNYLPMELEFTTSEGKKVRLGEYFKNTNKPAVLLLVYYDCPIVCDVLMGKVAETFQDVQGLDIGKDFNVLFFSFDPSEGPETSAPLRQLFLSGYNRDVDGVLPPEIAAGWQFHTSDAENSRRLADALGFKYRRMENGEYTHPVCTFLATPEGRIARYIYGYHGLPTSARDMRLALIEASNGELSRSIGDRFMSFCYMYDPTAGTYTLQAMRVMQIGGVITIIGIAGLIGTLTVTERIRRSRRASAATVASAPEPEVVVMSGGGGAAGAGRASSRAHFAHSAGADAPRSGGKAAGMAS